MLFFNKIYDLPIMNTWLNHNGEKQKLCFKQIIFCNKTLFF